MVDWLQGRRVALMIADGFEQKQLDEPRGLLERAGARVDVVSPSNARVRGSDGGEWSTYVVVDVALGKAEPRNYDALVVPGGIASADKLRALLAAQDFVRTFVELVRPMAFIGHAAWLLVDAEVAEGRKVTSAPSMRADLVNAGARWVDEPVVIDGPLVTCRCGEPMTAFTRAVLEEIARFRPRSESVRPPPPSNPYVAAIAPSLSRSGRPAGDGRPSEGATLDGPREGRREALSLDPPGARGR